MTVRRLSTAGVIFWQFGFQPYVSNDIFGKCRHCEAIQISAADSVFQNVIGPACQKAAQISKAKGQIIGCSPGATYSLLGYRLWHSVLPNN